MMKSDMLRRVLRRVLTLFLVIILLFPLLLTSILLCSVRNRIIDREFYKKLVDDERLYDIWQGEPLCYDLHRELERQLGKKLPHHAFSKAIAQEVTADYLKEQAFSLVDNVFDFIEGYIPSLELYLDLKPIKARLTGKKGKSFVETLAGELPLCATSEKADASSFRILQCRPQGVSDAWVRDTIHTQLLALINDAPDRFLVNRERIFWRPEIFWGGKTPKRWGVSFIVVVFASITACLWLAISFLWSKNVNERLGWLGWTLMVPAIILFSLGLLLVNADPCRLLQFTSDATGMRYVNHKESLHLAICELIRRFGRVFGESLLAGGSLSGGIAAGLLMRKILRDARQIPAPRS